MARTQRVASFEKRLSASAAGFGGASRTRISSGSSGSSMMVVLVRRWATGPDPFDLEGHIKGAGLLEGESA
jgi:hypothetical protein